MYVDKMTSIDDAQVAVRGYLTQALDEGPLHALQLSVALSREVEIQQRRAVQRALDDHTWAEIGAALGVSKQAAHRKFMASLAEEVKSEHRNSKLARRAGRAEEAVIATAKVVAGAELLRKARRWGGGPTQEPPASF